MLTKIRTPDREFFSGTLELIKIDSIDNMVEIMDGHCPFFTCIDIGVISIYKTKKNSLLTFFVERAFCTVLNNHEALIYSNGIIDINNTKINSIYHRLSELEKQYSENQDYICKINNLIYKLSKTLG